MTKLQYLKSLTKLVFSKRKKWKIETEHSIKLAFYSGGKPYYQLEDTFNTYVERGLEAYQIYEEILMRVDVKALDDFIASFENALNANPIKITDVIQSLSLLKERRSFVVPPRELIWKMASVKYFSEEDSPYTFEPEKAKKNVQTWKENKDVSDFFLYQRLENMIPLPKLSKETYDLLMGMIEKIQTQQSKLMNTSGSLSETLEENSTSSEKKLEPVI